MLFVGGCTTMNPPNLDVKFPETNGKKHLKMNAWNTIVSFWGL